MPDPSEPPSFSNNDEIDKRSAYLSSIKTDSGSESAHASHEVTTMAAVAEAQEVDDFGLPIGKHVNPLQEKTAGTGDGGGDAAEDNNIDNQKIDEDKPEESKKVSPVEHAQKSNATEDIKVENNGLGAAKHSEKVDKSSDSNSDDEDFQDAPSTPMKTPVPERADVGPKAKESQAAGMLKAAADGSEWFRVEKSTSTKPELNTDSRPTSPKEVNKDATPFSPSEEIPKSPKNENRERSNTAGSIQAFAGPSLKEIEYNKKRVEELNKVAAGEPTQDASLGVAAQSMSEFSHQQLTAPKADKDDDDGEWQTMPAYAPYDIYDDDNRLIAREHNDEGDDYGYAGLGGAGKGYTRVLIDDDAESETSMDGNTKYLFKDPLTTSAADDDVEQRDAVSQLQETKNLLTEGQRIAYVGATRLELQEMVKEAESIEHTKKTKKQITIAAEAMKMWSQKIMVRLYAHMEISPAEQVMIEQLAAHGVMPADLTPVLMQNARVKNPMAQDTDATPKISSTSPRPSSASSSIEEQSATAPPPYESHDGEEMPEVKTPSQLPSSDKIDIDIRWTVLCDLFLVLIADSIYDARSRVLLERIAKDLEIPWIDICRFEKRVTDALEMQQQAEKENWNEEDHLENRRKMALRRRYVMVGLATVGGGLVIGLSAGLLAPLIGAGLAAGFTTIGVGGTSSFLAGAGGTAIITSGAAASGSFMGGKAAGRRTGAVQTFEYRPLHNNKKVNLIVTISGWMTSKVDDVRLPYSTVDPIMGDIYSILWEPEMLTSMGDTINILATEALTQGLQQVLGSTILIGLMAALQLPVVLSKLAYLIDNPWAVSLDRATSAGLILADSLVDRNLGTRPVTLVGYSLGARVIASCLQELARKGAYGLVQNVYIFGSPIVVKKDEFLKMRTVVAGRFLNGYNRNDWILGYLFRLTNGGIRRVAGLGTIDEIPGVENMDCTEFVVGHMDYRQAMPRLLRECGWLVESDEFTEIEDPDPDQHREKQRELISEIEEARKELEKDGEKGKKGGRFSFFSRKKKAQRADWEVYEDKGGPAAPAPDGKTEDKFGNNHGVLFDVDAMRAELAREKEEEEALGQAKELSSTLPPLKLDLAPDVLSGTLRETISDDATTTVRTVSFEPNRLSQERTPKLSSGRFESSPHLWHSEADDDGIQMSFDDHDYRPDPPAKDSRPEIRTSQTVPNMALRDPWADDDEDFGKEKEISMTFA